MTSFSNEPYFIILVNIENIFSNLTPQPASIQNKQYIFGGNDFYYLVKLSLIFSFSIIFLALVREAVYST